MTLNDLQPIFAVGFAIHTGFMFIGRALEYQAKILRDFVTDARLEEKYTEDMTEALAGSLNVIVLEYFSETQKYEKLSLYVALWTIFLIIFGSFLPDKNIHPVIIAVLVLTSTIPALIFYKKIRESFKRSYEKALKEYEFAFGKKSKRANDIYWLPPELHEIAIRHREGGS